MRSYVTPIIVAIVLSGLATARSVFVPVDPAAARTWWQSVILWLQLWATVWAPEGTKGMFGGQMSMPFLHVPDKDNKMTQPPLSGTGTAAMIWLVLSLGMTACGLGTTYALLSAAEQVDKAAAAQLPDYDRQVRAGIVLTSKSTEDGAARLHDWDGKVEKLVKAVEGVHASVVLARDGVVDVSKGLRAKTELTGWIDPVLRAAMNLKNLLSSVGLRLAVQ